MLNVFKVYSLFISIIIGAGFASGKEVFTFFVLLKESSFIALVSSSLVFFLVIYATLEITRINKTTTYNEFLNIIIKNKILIYFFEIFIIFFMFVSFSSMIAGFTSLSSQFFNFTPRLARLLFVIVCFILLTKGYVYIIKLSIFLVPLFMLCSLFFLKNYTHNISDININNFSTISVINGITYSSYNLITAIAMICTMPELLKNKTNNLIASILISISLTIITISIIIPLYLNFDLVKTSDMPIYVLLLRNHKHYLNTYILLMILATLSTAIANAYSVTKFISLKTKTNYFLSLIFIVLCAMIFSLFGFSNIVNFIYPIFGFFGIIKIVNIIKKFFHIILYKTEDNYN